MTIPGLDPEYYNRSPVHSVILPQALSQPPELGDPMRGGNTDWQHRG